MVTTTTPVVENLPPSKTGFFIRGARLPQECERWLFVGDAPNDASMFAAFPCSVGVANLMPQLHRLPVAPRYMTEAGHGAGFVELARHLLDRSR